MFLIFVRDRAITKQELRKYLKAERQEIARW